MLYLSQTEYQLRLKNQIQSALTNVGLLQAGDKKEGVIYKIVSLYIEFQSTKQWLTAEDLLAQVCSKHEFTISISTTYRYLKWLTTIGLIERTKNIYKADMFRSVAAVDSNL